MKSTKISLYCKLYVLVTDVALRVLEFADFFTFACLLANENYFIMAFGAVDLWNIFFHQ